MSMMVAAPPEIRGAQALLEIISNPKAAQEALTRIIAEQNKLGDFQKRSKELAEAQASHKAAILAWEDKRAAEEKEIERERAELDSAKAAHERVLADHKAGVEAFEVRVTAHARREREFASKISEMERFKNAMAAS